MRGGESTVSGRRPVSRGAGAAPSARPRAATGATRPERPGARARAGPRSRASTRPARRRRSAAREAAACRSVGRSPRRARSRPRRRSRPPASGAPRAAGSSARSRRPHPPRAHRTCSSARWAVPPREPSAPSVGPRCGEFSAGRASAARSETEPRSPLEADRSPRRAADDGPHSARGPSAAAACRRARPRSPHRAAVGGRHADLRTHPHAAVDDRREDLRTLPGAGAARSHPHAAVGGRREDLRTHLASDGRHARRGAALRARRDRRARHLREARLHLHDEAESRGCRPAGAHRTRRETCHPRLRGSALADAHPEREACRPGPCRRVSWAFSRRSSYPDLLRFAEAPNAWPFGRTWDRKARGVRLRGTAPREPSRGCRAAPTCPPAYAYSRQRAPWGC
jgi:hypothetical protein